MKSSSFAVAILTILGIAMVSTLSAQNPIPFNCDPAVPEAGFGFYISSETETVSGSGSSSTVVYSNARLSKIVTGTGVRTTVCTVGSPGISVSLNGLAFNPHDNYLYAVSRYSASPNFSGKLYRIGSNCEKKELTVSGGIQKFTTNNIATVDLAGGNIGSGTFDLDNNYYVNTSFTNVSSSGFINKLQKIRITGDVATVLNTVNLSCTSCTGKVQVNDIIFDEASGQLIGSNFINNRLYSINPTNGQMTSLGSTGITNAVLGMYKDKDGQVRAVDVGGNIYAVKITAPANFTLQSTVPASEFRSKNADGASGCYAPPLISGHVFLDGNRLTDGTVNGTGTNMAGTSPIYANLIQGGLVVKTAIVNSLGYYQFLGLFSGAYEVQIGSILGTIGNAAPSQNLPASHEFVGDNVGAGPGSDNTPNGKLNVSVTNGIDVNEVNFGIDQVTVPIELLSFSARMQGNNALITWTTATEIDNDHFILERKSEDSKFLEINRKRGQLYSNQVRSYNYWDNNVQGLNYYRLRQVDVNGKETLSQHIIVRAPKQFFEIFPSVTNDKIYFRSDKEIEGLEIKIVNLNGTTNQTELLQKGVQEFDMSHYPAGIYLVRFHSRSKEFIAQQKIVKIN